AAVKNPQLIKEAAAAFGSQCIVLAVDVKKVGPRWKVFIGGGRFETERDALEWMEEGESLGAGELLLTSMNRDGTREGYDLELLRRVSEKVRIPLIASGGAGSPQHLLEGLTRGGADAVLAASIFHYGHYTIGQVKHYLADHGVTVRL
ncbi:MAG TPA: HisA/HisF-related TIM barrel protein, partial [Acidobacteriota bacterium]|nr:HisA/HisF-related TIM barrel protein [Acidobacteriota bacterium]